jgi:DNA mismatch repair protein MutL
MSTKTIEILSTHLSNMIAAGEVIERPSSVIKELVENSLDAKSSRIEIHIRDAGRTFMEVIDNGEGMSKDNLELSILRHATSKIKNEHDLFRIKTLGFRGEALPSIASVSLLTIASSTGDIGYTLTPLENGHKLSPSSARKGTQIIVKDLFYNTPARLKYLKNDYIEASQCIEVVTKFALAYPSVAFHFTVDEKVIFTTSGQGELLAVIQTIFGIDVAKKMQPIMIDHPDFKVKGYLGLPEIAKSHRYHMYTFVNGRIVYMPKLNQALVEAYQPFLPPIRFPFFMLDLSIEPSLLDVNVHPAKREIRFSKEELLKTTLFTEVSKILKQTNLAPMMTQEPSKIQTSMILSESNETDVVEQLSLDFSPLHEVLNLTVVGQLQALYIAASDHFGGIYLIDQHAAHERVNYEKNLLSVKQNRHKIEPLTPFLLKVSPSMHKRMTKDVLHQLDQVGVTIVPFGQDRFKIETIPLWVLDKQDPVFYVEHLLEQIFEQNKLDEDTLRLYAIASKSCKTSIKANEYLSLPAMQQLVDDLLRCDHPYTCPHGRPTMIQWSKASLEKLFNRSGF